MNKRLYLLIATLLLLGNASHAQFSENFSDGDFTNNPTWIVSNSSDWIVNASSQLQSNNTTASSSFYISTASTLATAAQWEMYVNLTFNASSANYVDVYLTASASDISQTSTTGYFVRIGNTSDNVVLYRKDVSGNTALITGITGLLNHSSNTLKLKVIRDASNQWILYRDSTGTGNNYFSEGSVTDATYLTSSFFGIFVKQSTASFFQRHFFDDIVVQPYVPDITPPAIQSVTTTSANSVDVLFNEPLDAVSSQIATNYSVNNAIGNPVSATQNVSNSALVHLSFTGSFVSGTSNLLTVNGVKDISNNAISNGTGNFTYFAPFTAGQYDVVIDEIMSDPTPQVGLPNNEWIELKNTSSSPINLQGWTIGDLTGTSGPMPSYVLQPDSFVIVCTGSAVAAMSAFGHTISVTSFPSLDNTGDQLVLSDNSFNVIHAVKYSVDWFQNELKKAGGWSLEMIDTKNPCSGLGNWTGSNDVSGGTPGRKNSVDADNVDQTVPKLSRAFASDSVTITLVFNEPLSKPTAATITNYTISNGIGNPQSATAVGPLFDQVTLKLNTPLSANNVYTITVNSVADCSGNIIGSSDTARVGLSSPADSFDIIINEILYNPVLNGVDYVELYNRSNKIINLKNISIANRNSLGVIGSIAPLSTTDYLLFPQNFVVATESPDIIKSQFITLNPDNFVTVTTMPSFSDASGDVVILNQQGNIVDELQYDDKWQFPLIHNTEGVALERIDYDAPTQSQNNWHSAATNVGYGTPTYKNSQYRVDLQVQGEVNVSPAIFSPDNDGTDDFATIDYNFPDPGYVANITIFDASGRPVRYLQRNALCGIKGIFRWDGLGDKSQKLAVGIYVIYTEIFNLNGKTKQFKNTIVLARRTN